MDRRRNRQVCGSRPVLGQHREHLLDEERVALGGLRDPGQEIVSDLGLAAEVLEKFFRLELRERLERDRLAAGDPGGMPIEQVGSRKANDQHRRVLRPPAEILDQVDEGRLGPLKVVEADDQRLLARQVLEQAAHRPHRVLGRSRHLPEADRPRQTRRDPPRFRFVLHQLLDRLLRELACRAADEVSERPVRDALPVRQAAAEKHTGLCARVRQQLVHQARLPDPGRAEHRHEFARVVANRFLEDLPQPDELILAADHRRIQPTRVGRRSGDNCEQSPRVHGLRAALQLERVELLDEDRVAREPVRLLSEQDLARAGCGLQALGERYGLTGGKGVTLCRDRRPPPRPC